MALKELIVTIKDDGRDQGKTFKIIEMPASKAEKWAARAFLALLRSGIDIPEDASALGMAGVAAMGLKAFSGIRFEEAEQLMDEMFDCIWMIPDLAKYPDNKRALVESDIEEIATRLRLRVEVLQLHMGFSMSAALAKSRAAVSKAA